MFMTGVLCTVCGAREYFIFISYSEFFFKSIDYIESFRADIQPHQPAFKSARGQL